MKGLLPVLGAACFTPLALWLLPVPYAWVAGGWAVALVLLAVSARAPVLRGACLSVAVLLSALVGAELLLWERLTRDPLDGCRDEAAYPQGYFEPFHEVLGYAPQPGKSTRSRRVCGDEVLYDVTYTIDEAGLRVSPPGGDEGTVLVFGGSFTFGEGVEDDDALPYRLGTRVADRYRAYNFGFHGYGPHQMLRALETGLTDELAPGRPVAVVYQMILIHLRRSAGMEPWDEHGPCYELGADGTLEHAGRFDEVKRERSFVSRLLDRSYLAQRLRARTGRAEIELLVGIVDAARREVLARNPEAGFHVLFWDQQRAKSDLLVRRLRERGIDVQLVSEILPGYLEDPAPYLLSQHDMHPNAAAYDRLAEYLVAEVLGQGDGR